MTVLSSEADFCMHGAQMAAGGESSPETIVNYYPCQGQLALSMPNFNEASLSDTLQLVYSYKIL